MPLPAWLQGIHSPIENAPLDPRWVEKWLKETERERAGEAPSAPPQPEAPTEPPPKTPEQKWLQAAREALERRNLKEALKWYRKLIRKKKLLDEVIGDLFQAQYEYPMEVEILVLLGDAYARKGRLQDALDTYLKAEQLLR